MNYHISASELAVITGHNHYRDVDELYIKYWQKYHKKDFQRIKEILEGRSGVGAAKLPERASESVRRLAKKHNIKREDVSKLFEASKGKTTQSMNNTRKQALDSMLKQIPDKEKEELKKAANSVAFTNFGTRNEVDGVQLFEEHRGVNVERPKGYYSNELFIIGEESENSRDVSSENPDTWSIGGKIDGIFTDNIEDSNDNGNNRVVLEIKNRVKGLFKKVRDYEKVQCYAYMFCLDLKMTSLAEVYKCEKGVQMGVNDIIWDNDFWENDILEHISEFVDDFYAFIKDDDRKIKIIS